MLRACQDAALQWLQKAWDISPICKSCLHQILSLCNSLSPLVSEYLKRQGVIGVAGFPPQVLGWQLTEQVDPRNFHALWREVFLGASGSTGLCSWQGLQGAKAPSGTLLRAQHLKHALEVSENKTHLLTAGKEVRVWHIRLYCISGPCSF